MSKRPTDDLEPAAKKRGSSRQLTKDEPSDEEEEDRGELETATEDVLKKRRIVKARRGTGAPPSTPTGGPQKAATPANPFAGVNLFGSIGVPESSPAPAAAEASTVKASKPASNAPTVQQAEPSARDENQPAAAATVEAAPENEKAAEVPAVAPSDDRAPTAREAVSKQEGEGTASPSSGAKPDAAPAPSFASLAATSAPFASLGTSTKGFGFGGLTNGSSSTNGTQTGEAAAAKPFSFGSSAPAFSFQPKEGGFPAVPSIFGASNQPAGDQSGPETDNIKPALASLPPELETVTGEEDEAVVWSGEGSLYEFDAKTWKERGRGELKINKAPGRPARFVMRQRGQHRLLMNANLWPQMKVTRMDGGKGATFPVINDASQAEGVGDGEPQLRTFAFRLKAANQLSAFIDAIEEHKELQKGA